MNTPSTSNPTPKPDFQIEDPKLFHQATKLLTRARRKLQGLIFMQERFAQMKPLDGLNIAAALPITPLGVVFAQTLRTLGATLRCAPSDPHLIHHPSASVLANDNISVYAWNFISTSDYFKALHQTLLFPNNSYPDILIDYSGDLSYLLHKGYQSENNQAWIDAIHDEPDETALKDLILDIRFRDSSFWLKLNQRLKGIIAPTKISHDILSHLASCGQLLAPVIDVFNSLTKQKFEHPYRYNSQFFLLLAKHFHIKLPNQIVVVAGYGHLGKGAAKALRELNAKVVVTEIDPVCALQATLDGFPVDKIEDVIQDAILVVDCTAGIDLLDDRLLVNMKNGGLLAHLSGFLSDFTLKALNARPNINQIRLKQGGIAYVFPNGHYLNILPESHVSFFEDYAEYGSSILSTTLSSAILAIFEIAKNEWSYTPGVHSLPMRIEEEVAKLHLDIFDAKLTQLSSEQAEFLGLSRNGPFKSKSYRY